VDYIGSKQKLAAWILEAVSPHIPRDRPARFLDACAGSCAMTFAAADAGMEVVANDLFHFSGVIARGRAGTSPEAVLRAQERIPSLNSLKGAEGYFTRHFTEYAGRLYFSVENAKKIDAIRNVVRDLPADEQDYLLACLLEAVSRVSNTTGVQSAFLKSLKPRARDPIHLRPEKPIFPKIPATGRQGDLLDAIDLGGWDVVYVDPPYNHRQYGPNYHLYETLVRDDSPEPRGKTGIRDWKTESDSGFCREHEARNLFAEIARRTRASKVLAFSYNSDGLLPIEDIQNILSKETPERHIELLKKEYPRYKADNSRSYRSDTLYEYLLISSKP
jgi:adenine-specific DNA-methyltransferase